MISEGLASKEKSSDAREVYVAIISTETMLGKRPHLSKNDAISFTNEVMEHAINAHNDALCHHATTDGSRNPTKWVPR